VVFVKHFIIDGIGPFFSFSDGKINWSKVPFSDLEKSGELDKSKLDKIKSDFKRFVKSVSSMGYNSITLDNLSHLVVFDFYDDVFKKKLEDYRSLYLDLFSIASSEGLDVFITSDVMFFNSSIKSYCKGRLSSIISLLSKGVNSFFSDFDIKGIIFRIGECDGVDVKGDFKSELVLKSVKDARFFIKSLLPVFEKFDKLLIFRTWSVGAYGLGRMMWDSSTFCSIFDGFDSKNLIVSMKYGEADFFRFLELNPLFFKSGVKKIVELQARREYEGFGRFPSFVGWQYARYSHDLKDCSDLVGICVWCQTGGWSSFKSLTFLDSSSVWNELNVFACIRLFRYSASVSSIVSDFGRKFGNPVLFEELLSLSDDVFESVWYFRDIANKRLFFRKIRVPPLLWIFWDTVLVNGFIISFLKSFVSDRHKLAKEGILSLSKLDRMLEIAGSLSIPGHGVDFMHDFFHALVEHRNYLLGFRQHHSLKEFEGFSFVKGDSVFFSQYLVRFFVRENYNLIFSDRFLSFFGKFFVNNFNFGDLSKQGMIPSVIFK